MADGDERPAKGEDGAEDADLKARCKPAVEDEDDEDNVPIAFSRGINKKKSGSQPKVKKEELDGEKTPKGKTPNKEGASLSKEKKEHTLSAKGKEIKKVVAISDGKASKVKKEEIEEGSNKTPKKGSTKGKPKKEGLYSDDDGEKTDKDKKKKKKKKGEVKKVVGKGRTVVATRAKDKKERKVYDLPGQKHDPPEERDPLRIFYETLHEQVPNSEMASTWMMEWGLLPLEEAKMVYQKKAKKSQQQKLGSPVKKTSTISVKKVTKTSSQTVSKTPTSEKKRKASEPETDDDDDKFILSKRTPKSGKKRKANESESDGDDDDDFVLSKAKKRKV